MAHKKSLDPAVVEQKMNQAKGLAESLGVPGGINPQTTDEPYIPAPLGAPPPSLSAEQQQQRSSLWEGYGLWDAVKDSYQSESILFAGITAAKEAGYPVDPHYSLPAENTPEWKALAEGVPEEYLGNFTKAVSAEHAQYLRGKILDEMDRDARLQEYAGTAGRMGLGLLNPEQLALAAFTAGGTSLVAGARTGLQAALRVGAANAAINVGMEVPLQFTQETRSAGNVAFAATGGMLLGGAFGKWSHYLNQRERDALLRAARVEMGAGERAVGDVPSTFGADSGGAARVNPDTLGVELRDSGNLPVAPEAPTTTLAGARVGPLRDDAAILHGVEDPSLRAAVARYATDPVGSSDGTVLRVTAAEEANSIRKQARARYGLAYENAYVTWAKEKGISFFQRLTRTQRRAFGEEVTKHRLGIEESASPAVKKMAAYEDGFYENFRKQAKEAGVKGFEELDGSPQGTPYRPRVWDKSKISDLASTERYGAGTISNLITKAFLSANPDADAAIGAAIGKGILKKLRETHAGLNEITVGLKQADGEWLQTLLRDVNTDGSMDDAVAYLKNMLDMKKNPKGSEGSLAYAKHRTILDESASVSAVDRATGEATDLPLHSLLVNDAGQLAETYAHRMSGAIGFARRAGVFSKADHEALKAQVLSHYEGIGDVAKGKEVTQAMDRIYKMSHGQTLTSADEWAATTKMRTAARSLRDWTYAATMNMAWVANLSDSASLLVTAQARRWFRYFPEMKSMFTRMQNGTIEHSVIADIEKYTGLAMEDSFNQAFSAFDDNFAEMGGKLAHGVRVGGLVTQRLSMLGRLQNLNQRLYGLSYATRIADNALGKSADLSAKRLASAGLDASMMKRIGAALREHATIQEAPGKIKLEKLNLDDWADVEARDVFMGAVARESRRAVQEEVVGDAPAWTNHWLGKVAAQFRRFGIVSHTKQMLFAVKHFDAESAQKLMWSMGVGSLTYAAQMYAYSLSQPKEKQQAFRDKYLTPGAILWGAFSRAGLFGLLPMAVQTAVETVGGVSPTQARSSGLSGNMIEGIPAVDLSLRAGRFFSAVTQSALRRDRRFDQKDFKNFKGALPYHNAMGVKQGLDMLEQLLPENDGDYDTKHADFYGF